MPENESILPTARGSARDEQLQAFADYLKEHQQGMNFKVSARGWCYLLEQERVINKNDFDRAESVINECREKGYLPVDFVAEEEARGFSGVETPESRTPEEYLAAILRGGLRAGNWYTPDWWSNEKFYIQMVVEKIDLKTLFQPVCEKYHIPIATSKGWSSILQRAEYARRFKEAEDNGLECVLLYCGDHDPDGLRISEFLYDNLMKLSEVEWEDGTEGYDPSNLKIVRFGLNFDFIEANHLTWIDNLITGSGKNLASPSHPNFHMPYVQDYLRNIGERKCEANAIVRNVEAGRQLCESAIVRYLGSGALRRFAQKRQAVLDRLDQLNTRTHYRDAIQEIVDMTHTSEDDDDELEES